MSFASFLKINSIIVAFVGISFFIPLATALSLGEREVVAPFLIPLLVSWIFAAIVFAATKKKPIKLSSRGTFFIVAFAWIFASLFGALPLFFSGAIPRFVDAVFESVSGFSTTGTTILSEVESLPRSINLWRCELHWLGGMGIVVLTVALLPLLGIGGFQLIKAETTGPEKGKVTPKITTTAKILCIINTSLTGLETVLLMLCGMDFIDALSHAFATLGTGGFSTRSGSIADFHSAAIDIVCTVFMILGGVNFTLYYYALCGKFSDVLRNSEVKAYFGIIVVASIAVSLFIMPNYNGFFQALRYGTFQVVTLLTTTGFSTADYTTWASSAQFILFILFFIGGSAGSTSGGIKVIRWVVMGKQVHNETKKMLHPHGIFTIRLDGNPASKDIVSNVASFMTLYFLLLIITTFVGTLGKLDVLSALTASLSMLGNIGPAMGKLGPAANFGFLPDFVKWFYAFAMLAGRLELYTMLIYFVPSFWKR